MNSLPETVTRQRSGCDLNPGPSAPESSTLTTRLPSHPTLRVLKENFVDIGGIFGFCSKVATQLRFVRNVLTDMCKSFLINHNNKKMTKMHFRKHKLGLC